MRDTLSESLKKLKINKTRHLRATAIMLILSLIVTTDVFWTLRQTGITMAGDATCGIEEHTHDEKCIEKTLVCALSEEGHTHTDDCYTTQLINAHTETILTCALTDEPHEHTDDCYETRHVDGYDEKTLSCDSADESHSHDETCYTTTHIDEYDERVLICSLTTQPHVHTDDCYTAQTIEPHEEPVLICELSEEPHTYTDDCYEITYICGKEEHTHSLECYSDENADVETPLDWQEMFARYSTGNLTRDLVAIARLQIGYTESERNFRVDDYGNRHGYTRYGAWYGAPYSDWSAMFVSFCLNYAGSNSSETPFNIGANAMASAWAGIGKYAAAADYTPQSGDLVFFSDNTVGIVTEVYGYTIHVVKGDIDNAVATLELLMTDASVTGWGLTNVNRTEVDNEDATNDTPDDIDFSVGTTITVSQEQLLDTSSGPAVYIFASQAVGQNANGISMFGLTRAASTNIRDYVENNNGTFTLTLLNTNDTNLPTDEYGNYVVTAGQEYKLSIGINLPDGIAPGTYTYQLPEGVTVKNGSGSFIIDDNGEKVDLGTWNIDENGLITFVFNEKADNYTDVTISATMGLTFEENENVMDFDGIIKVSIKPPEEAKGETKVTKGGHGVKTDGNGNVVNPDGNPITNAGGNYVEQETGFERIHWTVSVYGSNGSSIVGQTITDATEGNVYYTDADKKLGLFVGYTDPDGKWHQWVVYADDPALEWTETGWAYTVPETVYCTGCKENITLSNEGRYLLRYYSTVNRDGLAEGITTYRNVVEVDDKTANGSVRETFTLDDSGIVKEGHFNGTDGKFHWSITATLAGRNPDGKAQRWTIWDASRIVNANWTVQTPLDVDRYYDEITNFTVTYGGNTYSAYPASEAPSDAQFVYAVIPASQGTGITIYLGKRCTCTSETCMNWSPYGRCSYYWPFTADSGYCLCWDLTETATVQINFSRDGEDLINEYGGIDYRYSNQVDLMRYTVDENGEITGGSITYDRDEVIVPGIFKKELSKLPNQGNGYIATYTITVNEGLIDLRGQKPLTIVDKMSDTLVYIPGTMVVTETSADGAIRTLTVDEDYTIHYDAGAHQITLKIAEPGICKYTLVYDTQITIPDGATTVDYENSATVTLFGKEFSSKEDIRTLADINIAAKSYSVQVSKVEGDSGTSAPLQGAEFGLYAANGELVISSVTDADGKVLFQTSITAGIILREHVLYYIQEIQAPVGYGTDKTKYWFCFCNNKDAYCDTCTAIMTKENAFRIPYEEIGTVRAVNYIGHYHLPATGGPGIYHYILWGSALIIVPIVYGYILRRKRERRGDC